MIPMIPWWMGSVLASVCAVGVEWVNRSWGYRSFDEALPRTILPILLLQYGLFCSWNASPSLMLSWAVFFCTNVVLRVVVSYYIGEPMNGMLWLGAGLMVLGTVAIKFAR